MYLCFRSNIFFVFEPRHLSKLNQKRKTEKNRENKDIIVTRFDVSEYAPEEIMVKTVDNKLLVHAKHEEASGGRSVYREYNREFLLPHGTNPELIKSSLSKVFSRWQIRSWCDPFDSLINYQPRTNQVFFFKGFIY